MMSRKPDPGRLLDRSHPFCAGLLVDCPLNEIGAGGVWDHAQARMGEMVGPPAWILTDNGPALDFSGTPATAERIDLGYPGIGSSLKGLTLEWWATTGNTSNPASAVWIGNGSSYDNSSFYFGLESGKYRFIIHDGSNYSLIDSTGTISTGTRHHIFCVWDPGKSMAIWIDGVKTYENSSGVRASLRNGDTQLCVGRRYADSTYIFNGQLELFRIWGRTLHESEIVSLTAEPYQIYDDGFPPDWLVYEFPVIRVLNGIFDRFGHDVITCRHDRAGHDRMAALFDRFGHDAIGRRHDRNPVDASGRLHDGNPAIGPARRHDRFGHDVIAGIVDHISASVLRIAHRLADTIRRGDIAAASSGVLDRVILGGVQSAVIDSIHELVLALGRRSDTIRRGNIASASSGVMDRLSGDPALRESDDCLRDLVSVLRRSADKISGQVYSGVAGRVDRLTEKDIHRAILQALDSIGAPQPSFPSASIPAPGVPTASIIGGVYAIFLDGMPIGKRITDCRIVYDEAMVHNEIEIQSADRALWASCDPAVNKGYPRIEVHIGTRAIQFLLDDREMTAEGAFTIRGLSLSARNELGYLGEWTAPDAAQYPMAQALAAAMIPLGGLVWQVLDWPVPADFEFSGSPIESLQRLAGGIRAIVRCDDAGRLVVRKRWPVRPVNLPKTRPDIEYGRHNLTAFSMPRITLSEGYNCVTVSGADTSASQSSPQAEVEEKSLKIGDSVHLRVFWEQRQPQKEFAKWVTAGYMGYLGEKLIAFPEAPAPNADGSIPAWDDFEVVDFIEGKGSVSHPIETLRSVQWIGKSGGAVSFDRYKRELRCGELFATARVRYYSRCVRYAVSPAFVPRLLAAWGYGADYADVRVKVNLSSGDGAYAAPDVQDVLITSEAAAIERGTAELDDLAYDTLEVSVTAPYIENCVDGATVNIRNAPVSVAGNFRLKKVTIVFEGPAVWNEIEAIQCQV